MCKCVRCDRQIRPGEPFIVDSYNRAAHQHCPIDMVPFSSLHNPIVFCIASAIVNNIPEDIALLAAYKMRAFHVRSKEEAEVYGALALAAEKRDQAFMRGPALSKNRHPPAPYNKDDARDMGIPYARDHGRS